MKKGSFERQLAFRSGAILLWLGAFASVLTGGSPIPPTAQQQPARHSWESLRFRASKFGISATSLVERSLEASGAAGEPRRESSLWSLAIETRYLGRKSNQEILFDHSGVAAITRSWRTSGSSSYWNERIYQAVSVQRHRRAPSNKAESKKPRADWTEVRSWQEPYPEGWRDCLGFTEPAILLHFLALPLSDLSKELCFISKKALWRIELADLGKETVEAKYTDLRRGKKVEVRTEVEARKLSVRPVLLHGDPGAGFRLLGLEGDLTIHLHPTDGFPLRLAGRMPMLGKVTVFLNAVE